MIRRLENRDPQDPDLQWETCIKLGKVTDEDERERAMTVLIRQLQIPNCAVVRAHAVEALGRLKSSNAINPLIFALSDKHHLTRAYAADALAAIGSEYAVNALIERAENDRHGGVRAASLNALKKICTESTTDVCTKAKAVLYDTDRREKKIREELKKSEELEKGKEEERSRRASREVYSTEQKIG